MDERTELPDYADYLPDLRADCPELAEQVADFHGVGDVLDWLQQRGLGRAPIEMVGQDEFEYDLLIEMEPGGSWLVFGVT